MLITAARAIGTAAGTIAATVGVQETHSTSTSQPKAVKGRLQAKHKSRLPRRQKKALHKAELNATKKSAAKLVT